jgi:hypothetical protein
VADAQNRVRVWNSFLVLAREEAKRVFELSENCEAQDGWLPQGGTLGEERMHILASLVLCNLAIEARANHLIEELLEEGRLSKDVANAARRLPTKHKWFLLPALAGKTTTLSASAGPHQAIAELCDLRNACIHVSYDQLLTNLPPAGKMRSYFERFVEAMEDLNVVLERHGQPDPDVLKIGKLQCA